MKKEFFIRGALSALVFSMVMLFGFAGEVDAKTVYVDQSNNSGIEDGTSAKPYNTIQEGINATATGDTVKVAPGTYNENLTITSKNLNFIGGDPADTTIHGSTTVINISGTYGPGEVEIAGFTITGGATYGILANSGTVIARIHNNIRFFLISNG